MDLRKKLTDKRVCLTVAKRVKDLPGHDVLLRKRLGKRNWICDEEPLSQPTAQQRKRLTGDLSNITKTDHHSTFPQPQRRQQLPEKTGFLRSRWLNMIITDLHLHTIVEEKGFSDLMRSLCHNDEILPSASAIYSEMVQLYDQIREHVRGALEAAENITLACDFWNSKAGQFLVTVTCHFINKSWKQESFVLDTRQIPDKCSDDDTINQVLKIARTWGIREKVQVVVTNANNLEKAVQKSGWKHLSCFAKTLDKVARQITKQAPVGKVLERCCEVAHFFCYNAEAEKKLRETQIELKLPQQSLITAKGDAWLSTLNMLERISQQQEALTKVLVDLGKLGLVLTGDDRKVMQSITEALRPFQEVTEVMTKEQHCSASIIIPSLKELKWKLKEQKDNAVAQLLAQHLCSNQFKPADWLTMSTASDPRYKHIAFSDAEFTKNFKQMFLDEMFQKAKAKNSRITEASLHKRNFERLETYIHMNPLPQKGNLLNFWRFNQEKQGFDPKYLNVVPTAVPLDRAFDMLKSRVMSSRRSVLPPELLNMMLFLNGNCSMEAEN